MEIEEYSQAVVKLLNDSLKEGEVFVFRKIQDEGYSMILSEERSKLINTTEPSQIKLLLNIVNNLFLNAAKN